MSKRKRKKESSDKSLLPIVGLGLLFFLFDKEEGKEKSGNREESNSNNSNGQEQTKEILDDMEKDLELLYDGQTLFDNSLIPFIVPDSFTPVYDVLNKTFKVTFQLCFYVPDTVLKTDVRFDDIFFDDFAFDVIGSKEVSKDYLTVSSDQKVFTNFTTKYNAEEINNSFKRFSLSKGYNIFQVSFLFVKNINNENNLLKYYFSNVIRRMYFRMSVKYSITNMAVWEIAVDLENTDKKDIVYNKENYLSVSNTSLVYGKTTATVVPYEQRQRYLNFITNYFDKEDKTIKIINNI